MEFHILVDNLFIQEGIRSILEDKYKSSFIHVYNDLSEIHSANISVDAILISNQPSVFLHHQTRIKSLVLRKQLKTVLIANSEQLSELREKDIVDIDALIYTNCSLKDLNDALGYVQAGLKYRCKKINMSSIQQASFENGLRALNISERELEIVKLVIMGNTSIEIAEKLHISYNTVTTHRRNINKKLNLKHPQDLLRLSIDFKS